MSNLSALGQHIPPPSRAMLGLLKSFARWGGHVDVSPGLWTPWPGTELHLAVWDTQDSDIVYDQEGMRCGVDTGVQGSSLRQEAEDSGFPVWHLGLRGIKSSRSPDQTPARWLIRCVP